MKKVAPHLVTVVNTNQKNKMVRNIDDKVKNCLKTGKHQDMGECLLERKGNSCPYQQPCGDQYQCTIGFDYSPQRDEMFINE